MVGAYQASAGPVGLGFGEPIRGRFYNHTGAALAVGDVVMVDTINTAASAGDYSAQIGTPTHPWSRVVRLLETDLGTPSTDSRLYGKSSVFAVVTRAAAAGTDVLVDVVIRGFVEACKVISPSGAIPAGQYGCSIQNAAGGGANDRLVVSVDPNLSWFFWGFEDLPNNTEVTASGYFDGYWGGLGTGRGA